MAEQPMRSINMAKIPVAGIGGLGMVALVVVMAIALPMARWLLLIAGPAGLLLAAALVLYRRRQIKS
jgi:hypothetical protein